MEEFSRRIFLLIYGNPSKSEAIYPKTKIFGEKKSIFENSSGGRLKNQNGRPFYSHIVFEIIEKNDVTAENGRPFNFWVFGRPLLEF